MGAGTANDRLIHIADLHFWKVIWNPFRLANKRLLGNVNVWLKRRHEFAMERAESFAAHVAAQGIDQVLLTGDFASTAIDEEFVLAKHFVDGLRDRGMRLYLMPGNHDVYTFEAVRKRRFERYFAEYLPSTGFPCQSTLTGGTPLVMTPTVCPNLLSSRGRISDTEAAEVRALIESAGGPVLAAGHYPILNTTYGYNVSKERNLRNAEALHRALGETGASTLYICGHVHRFSFVEDAVYPSLRHLSTGAFFRRDAVRGREGEFSEIHRRGDCFDVYQHVFDGAWRREKIEARPGNAS